MFVVDITYTVPQEEVAAHRQEHVKWLEDAFTKGSFVMAGPKATKDGGILLSTCLDKDSLEAELNGDRSNYDRRLNKRQPARRLLTNLSHPMNRRKT